MLQRNECSAKNYGLSINSKSLKARQTKEQRYIEKFATESFSHHILQFLSFYNGLVCVFPVSKLDRYPNLRNAFHN